MIGAWVFTQGGGLLLNVSALFSLENSFFARKCVDVACNFGNMVYSMPSYGVFNH